MSEYTPITGELRERIGQAEHIIPLSGDSKDTQVRINLAWLEEKLDAIDSIHATLEYEYDELRMKYVNINRHALHVERENESLKAELDRVLGEQEDKALTYEEAEQLCRRAFDGGATYGSESMRYGVNARAYDWEHWLEKHESLFKPTDTWKRIIKDAIGEGMARQRNNDSGGSCERANPMNNGDLVARCKALCERTKEDA